MPIAWTADPAGRFAVLTLTDPYTIEEWRTALDALLLQPVYRARRAMLVDRRGCSPPEGFFVAQMAEFFAGHSRALAGAVAAVVVSDDTGYGMGRMTELTSEKENPDFAIRTFRKYDEAERWLTGGQSEPEE
jgi:hypothetical protein